MNYRVIAYRKPYRVWILLLLLALLLGFLFFCCTTIHLQIKLLGESQITLEYGEAFQEPGYTVSLIGTYFWKDGIPLQLPVSVIEEGMPGPLGRYPVEYRADFLWLQAAAVRSIRVVDTQCPVIELVPDPEDLEASPEYREAGFSAWDNVDGDITSQVIRTAEEGRVIYAVVDSSGNPAYAFREIPIYDITPPEIALEGGEVIQVPCGTRDWEPGFFAYDQIDGELTDFVTVNAEEVVWYLPGEYSVYYSVTDGHGNLCEITRTVQVIPRERPAYQKPSERTIYLTFDDGPCADTGRLLNILRKYNVKATFFVTDSGYPEMLQRIGEEGHSIGIHTRTHDYSHIYSSPEAFFDELWQMQEVIRKAAGTTTWLLRFPGGSSNTVSCFNEGIMTTLAKAVEASGFSYFDWNVDSDDAGRARKSETVYQNVIDGIKGKQLSVVLQHDVHPYSVDAVEKIICWGLQNGYVFRALDGTSPGMHHTISN